MIFSTGVVLGATLGTASGILTLCGLLCKSYRKGQLERDHLPDPEKESVLHSAKQFSIKKSTEPIQPRTLLEFPKIYAPKPSVTSPEVINQPEHALDVTNEPAAQETSTTKPNHGNLATEGSEEVFIIHRQAEHVSTDVGCEGYVEGRLGTGTGQEEARTSSKRLTPHVRWDEGLVFPLPKGYEEEGEVALSLHTCDHFSQRSNLGTMRFNLADVGMMSEVDCWADLQPPKKDTSPSAGEILLSISYLPAANRLGVVVMKARGLQSDKLKDTIDLSVKLALKHQSIKLKKKQTRRVKHKMNPVWNEMMMLEVPRQLLAKSSLDLEVLNLAGGGVEMDSMGHCQLGLQASGTGLQHWKQMLDNPRKQIAMWHPLYA